MENQNNNHHETSLSGPLVDIISKALKMPGIKVNRALFLSEAFNKNDEDRINLILAEGPVNAGCSENELRKIANALITKRTLQSTGLSFASGVPGGPVGTSAGLAADTIQFFGIALRLAQELSYLYGAKDLWADGTVESKEVTDQLILYIGVMFGVSGAAAGVRVLSSAFAKTALKRLPTIALTKTTIYPLVKSIAKILGARMTKNIFAKGVSKIIPVVGGVISGGITFVSMRPMGTRLADTLSESQFSYTEEEFEADLDELNDLANKQEEEDTEDELERAFEPPVIVVSPAEEIQKYKDLLDNGAITQEEYDKIKAKLIDMS